MGLKKNLQKDPKSEASVSMEPFIYLLLFLTLSLLSFFARWLKRELDGSADRETESKVFGLFQESPESFVYVEKRPQAMERKISEVPSTAPARSRRTRKKVTIYPGNLQEMRRGIILMTALGPCRALKPPNESLRF